MKQESGLLSYQPIMRLSVLKAPRVKVSKARPRKDIPLPPASKEVKETPYLKEVIKWVDTGDVPMVMAFDSVGVQVPGLQGRYKDVREKVLRESDIRTRFKIGYWGQRAMRTISREEW